MSFGDFITTGFAGLSVCPERNSIYPGAVLDRATVALLPTQSTDRSGSFGFHFGGWLLSDGDDCDQACSHHGEG